MSLNIYFEHAPIINKGTRCTFFRARPMYTSFFFTFLFKANAMFTHVLKLGTLLCVKGISVRLHCLNVTSTWKIKAKNCRKMPRIAESCQKWQKLPKKNWAIWFSKFWVAFWKILSLLLFFRLRRMKANKNKLTVLVPDCKSF